jgi:GGDEF domain-containing protein
MGFLDQASEQLFDDTRFIQVNDTYGHAAALRVYDRAIELARAAA